MYSLYGKGYSLYDTGYTVCPGCAVLAGIRVRIIIRLPLELPVLLCPLHCCAFLRLWGWPDGIGCGRMSLV